MKLSHQNTVHLQDFWKNRTVPKSWPTTNFFSIVYLNWGLRQNWIYGSYEKTHISRHNNSFPKYPAARCRPFLRRLHNWVSAKYHRTSMTWGSNLLEMYILEKIITIIHFVVVKLKKKSRQKFTCMCLLGLMEQFWPHWPLIRKNQICSSYSNHIIIIKMA